MLSFTLLVRAGGNTAFTRYTKLDCVPLSVSIFWFETIVLHREKYYLIEDRKDFKKNKWTILHCDPKKLVKAKYRNLNLKNRPLQKMNFCLKTISLYATSLLWYQERQIYFYIKATVSVILSDPFLGFKITFFVAYLMDSNTICSRFWSLR